MSPGYFTLGAGATALAVAAGFYTYGLARGPDPASVVCRYGYAREHRLSAEDYYPIARKVFKRDGIPWDERQGYELDHRVPICLGGTWELSNLQAQPLAEAKIKDELERHACREVCAGRIGLTTARSWFDDWRSAYTRIFHHEPR